MTSHRRPAAPTLIALLAALLLGGLGIALGGLSPARAASTDALQSQIKAESARLGSVQAAVAAFAARVSRAQSQLDAERAELLRVRTGLELARTRLGRLEQAEAAAERVLAAQLVNGYESDRPDLVSVVLEARGFPDLLERLSFAKQVSDHDARVVRAVRISRAAVAAEATRLGALEQRAQTLAVTILNQRNGLLRQEAVLINQRDRLAANKARKVGELTALRRRLARIAAQAAAAARANARTSTSNSSPQAAAPAPAPAPSSGGGFVFPMPKGSVAPEATWSLDDGVDISAPGGTPEFAVCSGTVVLHGIGGFGPSAPVLHCDSPLDGFDYVYYGHAGPGNWVAIGTHLSAGQVISEVGSGIVGISSGPHLEIGFADAAGSPVGPSSAPAMMALLRASFG